MFDRSGTRAPAFFLVNSVLRGRMRDRTGLENDFPFKPLDRTRHVAQLEMRPQQTASSSPHERHDFHLIPLLQQMSMMFRSGDEFPITFDGQKPGIQFQGSQKIRHRRGVWNLSRLAIHLNLHFRILPIPDIPVA